MSTAHVEAETLSPRKVWTREDAHLWMDCGFPNADKLELVEGELLDRLGKKPAHVYWKTIVRQWLDAVFGADFVRSEDPIDVAPQDNPTSEPEPDLVVTTRSIRDSAENPKPNELLLVVEISDTTVSYDLNVKAKLYARAGIQEYWVVNVPENKLVVHRQPLNGGYAWIRHCDSDEKIMPLSIDVPFCLNRL